MFKDENIQKEAHKLSRGDHMESQRNSRGGGVRSKGCTCPSLSSFKVTLATPRTIDSESPGSGLNPDTALKVPQVILTKSKAGSHQLWLFLLVSREGGDMRLSAARGHSPQGRALKNYWEPEGGEALQVTRQFLVK